MKIIHFIILFLSLCASAFAEDAGDKVKQLMQVTAKPFMKNNRIPGMAIAVYYHDTGYVFYYGYANKEEKTPVTKNTIFDLASITKVFTSTMLAYDVDTKQLKLSDPLLTWIPELKSASDSPISQVTLLQLATHTASLPRDVKDLDVPDNDYPALLEKLKTLMFTLSIERTYSYSNIGYGLLGKVLENASKQPYSTLVSDIILTPLEMKNTFSSIPDDKLKNLAQGYAVDIERSARFISPNLDGAGSLHSTIQDMLQFLKANLNVMKNNLDLQKSMQNAQQSYFVISQGDEMGLGWRRTQYNGEWLISKNGGNPGFSTYIGLLPKEKIGIVVLVNKNGAPVTTLGNKILFALER